jgi:hypothetical protein
LQLLFQNVCRSVRGENHGLVRREYCYGLVQERFPTREMGKLRSFDLKYSYCRSTTYLSFTLPDTALKNEVILEYKIFTRPGVSQYPDCPF